MDSHTTQPQFQGTLQTVPEEASRASKRPEMQLPAEGKRKYWPGATESRAVSVGGRECVEVSSLWWH